MKFSVVKMGVMLLLLLLFSTRSHSENSPSRVTLEGAKKYAIEHNFEVHSLRRAVEEARAKSGRAFSPFLPKIGVAGGVDADIASKSTRTAGVGYLYGNYNLFNGFEDTYRGQIADLELQKSEIRLKQAEFRVGLEVEKQFHSYLYLKQSISQKNKAIELNETHRKMAKQRRASGLASDSDIVEFDLRDSHLRSTLKSLEQELEIARVNLKKLLGQEVGAKIEPIGELQHQHVKGSLSQYLNRIKDESETVLLTSRDLAIATVESKLWRAKWLPKLEVETRAGFLPLEGRPTEGGASVSAMVLGKFELFSGLDTAYQKREGEAKRLRHEAQLKDAVLSAITQMEIAYRRIKTVEERVHLEEQNAERADKYYRSVISEYRRGVKNSSDVRAAAEGFFESSLKPEQYKYEFLTQRIELERALGGPVEVD